jgi:hypothetical protein
MNDELQLPGQHPGKKERLVAIIMEAQKNLP